MPENNARQLAGLLDDVLRAGHGAATTHDVETVTGHPPRSFDDLAGDPDTVAAWIRAVGAGAAGAPARR